MNSIIQNIKSHQLSKLQKILTVLAILAVIMINTNIKPSDYAQYVSNPSDAINLYVATVFVSGDAVAVGVLGQFVRVK